MPTQDERVKKYIVRLSDEERRRLEEMVCKGKASARMLARARILLKADVSEEGWSDSRIMEALSVSASLVYDTRRQLVEEGFEASITRKKRARPPIDPIFDGEKEAKLIALACSKPPAGRARWSLRLLEEKVVVLDIEASDSTIGRVLKKTRSSPTARNNGSSRPKPTAPSLPQWKSCSTSTKDRATRKNRSSVLTRPSNNSSRKRASPSR